MATQKHPKMANFTKNASQPQGHGGFKETQQNKRTVPGAGTNKHASPGKLKEGNLTAHAGQPSGKGIGFTTGSQGSEVKAVPGIYSSRNSSGIFRAGTGGAGYCFRGTTKSGVLRMSGSKGAHRLGKK